MILRHKFGIIKVEADSGFTKNHNQPISMLDHADREGRQGKARKGLTSKRTWL